MQENRAEVQSAIGSEQLAVFMSYGRTVMLPLCHSLQQSEASSA